MTLIDKVNIARRFQKSVRIDSDFGDKNALDGFICPQSSAEVLKTMARHISESGQGAFTWTGPYGSGKSSLAIALSALLNGNQALREEAANVFGNELTSVMWDAMPTGTKGWRILPVVGRRDNPLRVLSEALESAGLASTSSTAEWTESDLISNLLDIAQSKPKTHGGLILFVDEMGKFLESAAQSGSDLYIFQQIAEAASRSNGRFIFIGVLHQAFDEYAHRLSHALRDEWTKIQGRFVDLSVNTLGEEQIELISRAIEYRGEFVNSQGQALAVAKFARRERPKEAERLAEMLEGCWPLHPIVGCLLGPISRRRFGQNQRSIFGFLNSAEPYGFQDYLFSATEGELYTPSRLWEYLRVNLEPSILASPDGHRWALAAEALDRCEAKGGDLFLVDLLKTIAVIDLFKDRSGLLPSVDLLQTCFPALKRDELLTALNTLSAWSLIIFKKFQDAYAIFAGSDFNIDHAVEVALDEIEEVDFSALKSLASLQPILAKRHYHETGAMRWFDVAITPASNVVEKASRFKPHNGIVGQFLIVIPTENEDDTNVMSLCRDAAKASVEWDIVVGYSSRAWSIIGLSRELLALEMVNNGHPELAGDNVARREVAARLADLQTRLEAEFVRGLDTAVWYRKHHSPRKYSQSALNNLASELAEKRFNKCPKLHNELLNRQKPSGSAIAGQNALLRHMITREGEPRLGIIGYPTEGGLYASLLEASGLYTENEHGWQFVTPSNGNGDVYRLFPAWETAIQFIKNNKSRSVSVSDINQIWSKQPFGIKEGLMPVLTVAFILSQRESLAIYREGIFRARFDEVDVEYMAKDPGTIQLRWMDLDKISRQMLSDMAEIVRELDDQNKLTHLQPIDVARGLVAIYEQLPNWTKRTMRLSSRAIQIRDIFKRAHDPNKFLFDDIPALLDSTKTGSSEKDTVSEIVTIVKEGLQELVSAYPLMINRLRDILLAELQVPNISPQSLLELRARAENIKELAGDFRLDAFVGRLSQFNGDDEGFEGIASLAANKPSRDWVDPDMDRASIELADMAQKFLKAETYTRIKGRPEKRQAMAVMIGIGGKPTPLLKEFNVIDTDKKAVDELVDKMANTVDGAEYQDRNIILAALAELSSRYIQDREGENKLSKGAGQIKYV